MEGGEVVTELGKRERPATERIINVPSRTAIRPKRPARLDTRLPAPKERLLRKLHAAGETRQRELFSLYLDIVDSIRSELSWIDSETARYALLSRSRRIVVLVDTLDAEVRNGGFDQYYSNPSGGGASLLPAALRAIGQDRVAKIVDRCNARFRGRIPRDTFKRMVAMERLGPGAKRTWSRADSAFYRIDFPLGYLGLAALVPFILQHPKEFFESAR